MARGEEVRANTPKIMWGDFNGEGLCYVTRRSMKKVTELPLEKVERLFFRLSHKWP